MPQEFQVLRCCSCDTFQVHQVKKSKKWNCKMCGQKQSMQKVYGRGTGAECRHHVQKLNTLKGETEESKQHMIMAREQQCYGDCGDITRETQSKIETQSDQVESSGSRWQHYLDNKDDAEDTDEDTDGGWETYTTDRKQFDQTRQYARKQNRNRYNDRYLYRKSSWDDKGRTLHDECHTNNKSSQVDGKMAKLHGAHPSGTDSAYNLASAEQDIWLGNTKQKNESQSSLSGQATSKWDKFSDSERETQTEQIHNMRPGSQNTSHGQPDVLLQTHIISDSLSYTKTPGPATSSRNNKTLPASKWNRFVKDRCTDDESEEEENEEDFRYLSTVLNSMPESLKQSTIYQDQNQEKSAGNYGPERSRSMAQLKRPFEDEIRTHVTSSDYTLSFKNQNKKIRVDTDNNKLNIKEKWIGSELVSQESCPSKPHFNVEQDLDSLLDDW